MTPIATCCHFFFKLKNDSTRWRQKIKTAPKRKMIAYFSRHDKEIKPAT